MELSLTVVGVDYKVWGMVTIYSYCRYNVHESYSLSAKLTWSTLNPIARAELQTESYTKCHTSAY